MGKKGLSAEELALIALRELGFEVLEHRKPITLNGVKVAEVDAIVRGSDGLKYAVEVKAGRISVTDIRQAYANARVINLNPLIVCKGFYDEAAQALATSLKVKVIRLPEYFLFTIEELKDLLVGVAEELLITILRVLGVQELDEKEVKLVKVISEVNNFSEVAKRMGLKPKELTQRLRELRDKGVNFSKEFRRAKLQALVLRLYIALRDGK